MLGEAQYKELPATSRLVGSVRPNRVSQIGAEVAGLVAVLRVREGAYLKKGEMLCQLKADILRLELQAANNKLESLKAAVDAALADLERWKLEKERIESLENSRQANVKEVYDTLADFLIAQNKVREAKQDVAEQEALVALKKTEIGKTKIVADRSAQERHCHAQMAHRAANLTTLTSESDKIY